MPNALLFEAPFSQGNEVAERWAQQSGADLVREHDLLTLTEASYGFPKSKLRRALSGSLSVFNAFTHEHERAIAYLKGALAQLLQRDGWVYCGPATLLVPASVSVALRVGLMASSDYRASVAAKYLGIPLTRARRRLAQEDAALQQWASWVVEGDPFLPSRFDILLPMHARSVEEAVQLIRDNIAKPVLARTPTAEARVDDFRLAAAVNIRLAEAGYDVGVESENGYLTIAINRYTLRLEKVEEDIKRLAMSIEGVKEVVTRVGPRFRLPSRYVELDAETPTKVLLVDDERDFVQTLSERLLTRNVPTAVAYNGEEALTIIAADEPEVVVLDLQMPGIDGIEVLRRLKKGHPNTQVIILTGHGSEKERRLAEELGAFAYLQKPVDINVLSRTMKEAYKAMLRLPKEGSGNEE